MSFHTAANARIITSAFNALFLIVRLITLSHCFHHNKENHFYKMSRRKTVFLSLRVLCVHPVALEPSCGTISFTSTMGEMCFFSVAVLGIITLLSFHNTTAACFLSSWGKIFWCRVTVTIRYGEEGHIFDR